MILKIGLIDYGMGNLYSVKKSFERLNQNVILVNNQKDLINCDALVLPGVGAFDPAMQNLEKTKLIPYIKEITLQGKPLLGICLGLQLLFESSEEGFKKGLGLFKGEVKKLPNDQNERIPHMGWSKLNKEKNCPLTKEPNDRNWMYFVHSYSAIVTNQRDLAATIPFGEHKITSIIWKDNIGACQFHPEKSGKSGHKMLFNWLKWVNIIIS